MEHGHLFWMGGMWVFPLLMMVIMVFAIFICARLFLGQGDHPSCCGRGDRHEARDESPLEIAKRRYAQGEITKEEFEEMQVTLTPRAHKE